MKSSGSIYDHTKSTLIQVRSFTSRTIFPEEEITYVHFRTSTRTEVLEVHFGFFFFEEEKESALKENVAW